MINFRRIGVDEPSAKKTRRSGSAQPTSIREDFKYSPQVGEEWKFDGEEIFYNGHRANDMINEYYHDSSELIWLSSGLAEYKNEIWSRLGKMNPKFNGRADVLLSKIEARISCLYEEKMDGIRCQLVDGNLWINGVNVSSLIDLYRNKPEPKIRAYLLIWRQKLATLLSACKVSGRGDGWKDAASKAFCEMEAVLGSAANSPRLLYAGQ